MPLRTDIVIAATACAIVRLAALGAAPPDDAVPPAAAIDFAESLETAQALVADAPRPIVLQFGASWCGWCRKLDNETFRDPTVLAMAPKFAWVHVDVDREPALASAFGARALPHAVMIDPDGRVLAESRGFSDGKGYAAFLARGEAAYVPANSKPLEPAAIPDRVRTVVETMAPPTATGRIQAVAALRRLGPAALTTLVELLEAERLAVRAAAAHALLELADADIGFDPMAPAAERAARAERWRVWLGTDAARALRKPPAVEAAPALKPAPKPAAPARPAAPAPRPSDRPIA